jgi:nitroreductase
MVRSFDGTPADQVWLDDICSQSLWSPTAGNSAGVRMYNFTQDLIEPYLAVATDEDWRRRSKRAAGLARAGGGVVVTSRPQDYVARYSESDKASSGLGDQSAWPIPYWHTDAAMATMALLLLIEESGWQATIWGNFRHDEEVLAWIGAPDERLFASVLIGIGDGNDEPSASLSRPVEPRSERVRRVRR